MRQYKRNNLISLVLTILLYSKLYLCKDYDDYWIGDFDPDKNCEKEELIKKLMNGQNPSRCALKSKGNNMYNKLGLSWAKLSTILAS